MSLGGHCIINVDTKTFVFKSLFSTGKVIVSGWGNYFQLVVYFTWLKEKDEDLA